MCGYNGGIIKYCVRNLMIQDNKRPGNKAFPSMLCIIADLLEHDESVAERLESDILECDPGEICGYSNRPCLRLFYGLKKEHFKILGAMHELPKKYQIIAKPYKKKTDKKYRKRIAKLMEQKSKVYFEKRIKADVIYKLFSYNTWDCPCSIEEYIASMSCLFYFFPEILSFAIGEECSKKAVDPNIQQAIRKCVQFYIKVDKVNVDKTVKIEDIILDFNNLHEIREIELVLGDEFVEDTAEAITKREYVVNFCEMSNSNFETMCNHLSQLNTKRKKLEALIGAENMKYIYSCGRGNSGFRHQCG